uniref:SPK domain-containing protein n=1 Tax=Globodera pallida TaxID=36090 RepID=A0A183BS85_GLOPA
MANEGVVGFNKKKRCRYTQLDERKMWHFFLRELKAQNPDALMRRQVLWELYEQEEKTMRKMYGLESHFRKYMLPRVNHAAVPREDLFLLFRFFRAQFTAAQREELENLHDCEIETEQDGTFLHARVEIESVVIVYPTLEQEGTILRFHDDTDADTDPSIKEEANSVVEDSFGEESGEENCPPRRQPPRASSILAGTSANNGLNSSRNGKAGWISKSALLSRPPPPRPPKRNDLHTTTTTNKTVFGPGDKPLARSTPQQLEQEEIEQYREDRRSSVLPQLEPPTPILISRQSTSEVAAAKTHPPQSDLTKLKRHFLKGSVALLKGRMDLNTFVNPFVGSEQEKGARVEHGEVIKSNQGQAHQDRAGARIINNRSVELPQPIPLEKFPDKVIGFKRIEISYFDQTVMEFLRRMRRLFDSSGTNVWFDTSYCQNRSWEIIRQIWPLVNDNICGLTEDNAGACCRQALAKWLFTPRADGLPKMLYCSFVRARMDGLKRSFANALEPANFILRFEIDKDDRRFVPFELKNNWTGERLTTLRLLDKGLLVRCPVRREEDKWAKWEEEAIQWKWQRHQKNIAISFEDSDIGDVVLENQIG